VFAEHLLDPDFLHAVKLTLQLAAVAVPINVLFGVVAAINITRNEFPGKAGVVMLVMTGSGQAGGGVRCVGDTPRKTTPPLDCIRNLFVRLRITHR
jgi:hypothetical protein